ncbi:hypothetical protein D3C76_1013150 [compost metagenome]
MPAALYDPAPAWLPLQAEHHPTALLESEAPSFPIAVSYIPDAPADMKDQAVHKLPLISAQPA